MRLKDNGSCALLRGVYLSSDSLGSSVPEVYFVFRKRNKWVARDYLNHLREVSCPEGMPDSSIMPTGKIDSSDLVRLPYKNAKDLLDKMRGNSSRISGTITFLEAAFKNGKRKI